MGNLISDKGINNTLISISLSQTGERKNTKSCRCFDRRACAFIAKFLRAGPGGSAGVYDDIYIYLVYGSRSGHGVRFSTEVRFGGGIFALRVAHVRIATHSEERKYHESH